MIARDLQTLVTSRLAQFPAVAILGPRQVGKTTLVRAISGLAEGGPPALYLDLENPSDLERLSDARSYLMGRSDRLIILDEIQRAPGLFQILRGVIDERIALGQPHGQFVLLGSASIDLLKQSSESLAGRIAYLELTPLTLHETGPTSLERLWLRGGFPPAFLASSDERSAVWRNEFITTYLERDIPQLGPRIPATTLRRFWTMLAHNQAGLLNAAQLASALGVDGKTVASYLDLMVDLLLVRRLQPLHANVSKRLVKSPKVYVRDPGLLHALLGLEQIDDLLGHPVAGASWEGFCIEQLMAAAPPRSQFSFYRTAAGAEIDLVIDLPRSRRWAVEIKRSSAPRIERGTHIAVGDLKPEKTFIVYGGEERYPKGEGREAIPLFDLICMLRSQ